MTIWIIAILFLWLAGFEIRIGKYEYKFKGGMVLILRLICKKKPEELYRCCYTYRISEFKKEAGGPGACKEPCPYHPPFKCYRWALFWYCKNKRDQFQEDKL
jgi:hypothetical protein